MIFSALQENIGSQIAERDEWFGYGTQACHWHMGGKTQ